MTEETLYYPEETNTYKAGDAIELGTWWNKPEVKAPLRWIVLDQDEQGILLVSENLIDTKPFHDKLVNAKWKRCSLRKWLNGEFYKEAFSREERKRILEIHQEAFQTKDHVILVTKDLFERYPKVFSVPSVPTAYAKSKGDPEEEPKTGYWWWVLGRNGSDAMAMPQSDPDTLYFYISTGQYYVRPVIRLRNE